jgi:hypothetical protein
MAGSRSSVVNRDMDIGVAELAKLANDGDDKHRIMWFHLPKRRSKKRNE